ncbi:probable cyclic nucleotide-gated ion channel 12, partial [Arabidopsis lyrata subsp. lyrata]
MEERKRDIEKWMSYRNLPDDLKQRIRKYGEYTWKQTRGIEEEALLRSLPIDLRLETKRHLYLNLLKGVPLFEGIDDGWLLAAVCNRVKYVFYSADSYIVKEGDPLEEMLIITKGKLKSTTRSHEIGEELKAGDICGQLLFNSSCLPTSTRTIITLTEVEGFTLSPDDVKFVASHFNHLQSVIHKQMSRQGLETEVGFKVF